MPIVTNFDITYRFKFADVKTLEYQLQLNSQTLELVSLQELDDRPWKKLDFNQCPNCPLDSKSTPLCPVANNLSILIDNSSEFQSHDDVYLEVITSERVISANTTIQRGLSSLLGLILATSDCPHMRYFRPMARFHLPLATEEETIYRATSMYLLAQYFKSNEHKQVDLNLTGLSDIYQNLQIINKSLATRLRAASDSDAAVNAVVLLDLFAKTLPYSITDSLDDIHYLFSSYSES